MIDFFDEIQAAFVDHFDNLFLEADSSTTDDWHWMETLHFPTISSQDQASLNTPFTVQEVRYAAFQIGALKAPRSMEPQELLSLIKRKKRSPIIYAGLKLDMNKAMTEWGGLSLIKLCKVGLSDHWRLLIRRCLSSVSFQVLVNGKPAKSFQPTRDLRQGDPLFPYLFILCANVFSLGLSKATENKQIRGLKIARHSPSISHLLFADGCYLFFQTNFQSCTSIKSILDTYCRLSGQCVNFDKSECFFSPNSSQEFRVWFSNFIGVDPVDEPGKYLGNPRNL